MNALYPPWNIHLNPKKNILGLHERFDLFEKNIFYTQEPSWTRNLLGYRPSLLCVIHGGALLKAAHWLETAAILTKLHTIA